MEASGSVSGASAGLSSSDACAASHVSGVHHRAPRSSCPEETPSRSRPRPYPRPSVGAPRAARRTVSKAREGCNTLALSRHSGVRSISLWPIRIHELDSVGCNRSRARSARASGRGRSTLGFAPFQDTRLRGEESPLTRSITLILSHEPLPKRDAIFATFP